MFEGMVTSLRRKLIEDRLVSVEHHVLKVHVRSVGRLSVDGDVASEQISSSECLINYLGNFTVNVVWACAAKI